MNEMIVIDLPKLQSIELGHAAIDGDDSNLTCSLRMRSMNPLL